MRFQFMSLGIIALAITIMAAPASAQYASISGRVTDTDSGAAIDLAQVAAINMSSMLSRETLTDSSGYYYIDSLTPGYHIVGAYKEGYEEDIYPGLVEIVGDEHLSNIDIQITYVGGTGIGSISGQVVDAETGDPMTAAGITITGFPGAWYTDSDGNYFCDSIPDGIYQVSASREGYFPETYPEPVTVIIGATTENIDFLLTPFGPPGSISGTVTNAETGLPIENVYVYASGRFSSGHALTDSDGNYLISDLIAGEYSVSAWSDTYEQYDYPEPVIVSAGENTTGIDFTIFLSGPGDGVISGTILEEGTLAPVPLGMVIAYSDDNYGGAFTEPDGSYTIEGLPPDAYFVIAIIEGYVVELYDGVYTWEGATPVIPDASGIDFILAPEDSGTGFVTGTITSGGAPVKGAIVFAEKSAAMMGSAQSSADGTYLIDGLSPGTYVVKATMVAYQDASYPEPIIVGGGPIEGVDIELIPMPDCDANGDGSLNIGDAVFLVNYIFKGGDAPIPLTSGDANCDSAVNIADAVYLINYIFKGGPEPCCP